MVDSQYIFGQHTIGDEPREKMPDTQRVTDNENDGFKRTNPVFKNRKRGKQKTPNNSLSKTFVTNEFYCFSIKTFSIHLFTHI